MSADAVTPLDRDTAAFLQWLVDREAPPLTSGTVEEARAVNTKFLTKYGIEPRPVETVEELVLPTASGSVAARRYLDGGSPAALLVFLHGGGWVLGDLEGYDPLCRLLAADAGVEVLCVDYRRAPEHPFPAAFDDSFAAVGWAAENLAGERPLLVGGDSAGGNLTVAVALRARAAGSPEIAAQILFYPVLDHDLDTDSYRRFGSGYVVTRDDMAWFFDQYVPDPQQRADPYVSPLRAADLSGLPPTYMAIAGYDPLRDEGIAFTARLQEAGVPTTLRLHDSMIHGFLVSPKAIPSTAVTIAATVAEVGALAAQLAQEATGGSANGARGRCL